MMWLNMVGWLAEDGGRTSYVLRAMLELDEEGWINPYILQPYRCRYSGSS